MTVVAASRPRGLHIALWVAQVLLLGVAFIFAGFAKATQPLYALAERMLWVPAVPNGLVRFIGISEFLGGLGLILPSLTRIKPWLTPLAAAGLATIMVLAALFHISRGEAPFIAPNIFLGSLAVFVAWGRYKKAPIAER
jgi:putative oxidoreductase